MSDDEELASAEAGDPACWAALVCPACGRLTDDASSRPTTCPNCGEAYPSEE